MSPEHNQDITSRPARDKKCVDVASVRAWGQGGKPGEAASQGKPPAHMTAKHRDSRKKRSEATTAVPSEARVPAGACPLAGGEGAPPRRPTRPTAPQGRTALRARRAAALRRRSDERRDRQESRDMKRAVAHEDKARAAANKGGSPLRLNRQRDDRGAAATTPTKAVAAPKWPTERNKLPSGAEADACATKEQGRRARPALIFATTAPHGLSCAAHRWGRRPNRGAEPTNNVPTALPASSQKISDRTAGGSDIESDDVGVCLSRRFSQDKVTPLSSNGLG